MKKYTSFIIFLLDTPKNLMSVAVIWAMALAGIIVSYQTKEDFDPGFYEGTTIFLVLIMILAWVRVWAIYKKNS